MGLAVRQVNAPHSQISISLTLCVRLSGPATSESQFLSPIIRDPSKSLMNKTLTYGMDLLHLTYFEDTYFANQLKNKKYPVFNYIAIYG